jgi:hypothetical protein
MGATRLGLSTVLLASTVALLPLLVPSGPGQLAPVDVPAAAYGVCVMLDILRSGRLPRLPMARAFGVLLLASVVALVFSADRMLGLRMLLIDLYLCWLFLAVVTDLTRRTWVVPSLLNVWIIASLAWTTVLVAATMPSVPGAVARFVLVQHADDRVATPTGSPNLMASYLL